MDRTEELANNEMESMRRYVDLEVEEMGKVWCLLRDRKNTMVSLTDRRLLFKRESRRSPTDDSSRSSLLLLPIPLFCEYRSTLHPTASSSSEPYSSRMRNAVSRRQETRRASSSRLHRLRSRNTFTTRHRYRDCSVGLSRRLLRGCCELVSPLRCSLLPSLEGRDLTPSSTLCFARLGLFLEVFRIA